MSLPSLSPRKSWSIRTMNRIIRKGCVAAATTAIVVVSTGLAPAVAASGTVNVYYAASLKALNEVRVGPSFQSHTGYTYQGFPNNSGIIVNELKAKPRLITPDVVEFADAGVNAQLMGHDNGDI